jgi:ribosome-binding factor A
VSFRDRRELRFPPKDVVCPDAEPDPGRFFGDEPVSRKRRWKVQQLCKQVERAAAVTLSECGGDELREAWVVSVEPAPDASRLRVTVVLGPTQGIDDVDAARAALVSAAPAFRDEVARSIHRKRVPEIVFEVGLGQEIGRE